MRPVCLIRADASVAIGGGHVIRCMALAEALAAAGWQVSFACTADTLRMVPALARYPNNIDDLDGSARDVGRILARCALLDLLVIDGYGFDAELETAFRTSAKAILAIDDEPSRTHTADVLLDQTLGRTPDDYAHLVPPGAMCLCGSRFALLRAPFVQARMRGLLPVAAGDRLKILVNFGLTDACDATGLTLAALSGLPVDLTVVIGSHAPHRLGIDKLIRREGAHWRNVGEVDAASMAALTAESDVVIGAPGSASYERCCLGRPSLLVILADNQRANAAALAAAGAAVVVGEVGHVDASGLRACLSDLLADRDGLRSLAANAARVADGEGARRVASLMTARAVGERDPMSRRGLQI